MRSGGGPMAYMVSRADLQREDAQPSDEEDVVRQHGELILGDGERLEREQLAQILELLQVVAVHGQLLEQPLSTHERGLEHTR